MAEAGYVDADDAGRLADAYRLLRTVEHRLQLVDEQQVHTLPEDPVALDRLARVMGMRDTLEGTAAEQLDKDLRQTQATVRSIHERVYFRPLLEAFAGADAEDAALSPEAAAARLTAFGFVDARRTQAAVKELTRGLNRSSRLMQQLLPLLLDWLSQAPDPDLGPAAGAQPAHRRAHQPLAGRDLPRLAGRRPVAVHRRRHQPPARRDPHPQPGPRRPPARPGPPGHPRPRRSRHHRRRRRRDAGGPHRATGRRCGAGSSATCSGSRPATSSATPTSTRSATTSRRWPRPPSRRRSPPSSRPSRSRSSASGRFGGAELAYASDLDVIFVHDAQGASGTDEAKRLATALMRFVGGTTPADRIYDIDADLRPEGRSGPLARSLGAFDVYWREHALTWERQAMTRARVVAGDRALGDRLLDMIEPYVWDGGLDAEAIRDIRRMKARIESERIPPGRGPRLPPQARPGLALRRRVHGPDAPAPVRREGHRHARRPPGPLRERRDDRSRTPRSWPSPTSSASGSATGGSW